MNGRIPMEVGVEVMCRMGDAACVLAPTHTYTVTEKRRDDNNRTQVRVKNSLGEDMPGWFPLSPHFA